MDDAATHTALEAILREAAKRARHAPPARVDLKAKQDYVTDIDLAVDAFLEESLSALTPGIPVLSEERAVQETGELDSYWIVDPIDGTMNLMCRLPFVGVSVALIDSKGPRLAGVASVADGVVYMARRGHGALCDGQSLDLSSIRPCELITISTGLLDVLVEAHSGAYTALRQIGKIRNLGAQALNLCFVASGGLAVVASIEAKVWDEAAGGLIVREAGGVWRAASDIANWRSPREMMTINAQRSLACHPDIEHLALAALDQVL